MHHPTDRIAHTTAFVTPVVEHWLEREIAQWVHPMKDRFDDPSHHERTLLPRSYISLPLYHEATCRSAQKPKANNYIQRRFPTFSLADKQTGRQRQAIFTTCGLVTRTLLLQSFQTAALS